MGIGDARPGEPLDIGARDWNWVRKNATSVHDPLSIEVPGSGRSQRRVFPSSSVDFGYRMAEITAINATTLDGKWLDENGDPIGDAFEIFLYSYTDVDNSVGTQNPDDCYPTVVVGQRIRVFVTPRSEWSGTEWLNGYWAFDRFDIVCDA